MTDVIDDDFSWEDDTLREECGVFGIYNNRDAAVLTALGLHALQHRGQEAAGIVSFDVDHFHSERRPGLVTDHFSSEKMINSVRSASFRKKTEVSIMHLPTATPRSSGISRIFG